MIELLYKQNKQSTSMTISKLDFETTRLFLEKKIFQDMTLSKLSISDKKLLYDGDILLLNVIQYDKITSTSFINIKICIKKDLKICQDMIFKIY